MEPIFNSLGVRVSWLICDYIHDVYENACAFIRGSAVYFYRGEQIGWFKTRFFRDAYGDAVGFMRGCSGGPLPPFPHLPPVPPLPSIPPLPPLTSLPALPPLPTFNWSGLTWEEFVGW